MAEIRIFDGKTRPYSHSDQVISEKQKMIIVRKRRKFHVSLF